MTEPLAIVGMACRVPGADDPDELWQRLVDGECLGAEVPAERLAGYDTARVGPGGRGAALMSDVDSFDADFFDVKPRLAAWMDPQQRLLLETSWHAMESAAIPPSALSGTDVGVFVSSATSDFRDRLVHDDLIDRYTMVGTATTFLANRLSFQYDFRGPSVTVNTACSGGLSALALAATSLRAGEIDAALVGAVNVCVAGWMGGALAHLGALSPTHRARPFAPDADGYLRGEGVVCFVVKRLADALAADDPVRAVIRGIAASHDGRAGGPVQTDAGSQARLVRRVLEQAGLSVADLGYLEAHAPGTKLDGNELDGVGLLLAGCGRPPAGPDDRLWIGSVKAVLGHLEAAAGAASLAKAVLVLRNGAIPTRAGLLAMDGDREVSTSSVAGPLLAWPAGPVPRRAGVSSFGLGGSNAHVVVEEPPAVEARPEVAGRVLVPLSGTDPSALRRVAERLMSFVDGRSLVDVAWTLRTGRDHLPARAVLAATTIAELRSGLAALARGVAEEPADVAEARRWCAGEEVDWSSVWAGPAGRRIEMPGYPFRYRPFGLAPARPTAVAS